MIVIYIWSHTIIELSKAGYDIVIVDNLSNSSVDVLDKLKVITNKKIKFYECDIQDKMLLESVFIEHNFDGVMHFAWLKAVWESCSNPFDYYDNNIYGSTILFRLMEKYNVKKIVFSSSATVYNVNKNIIPFIEDGWLKTSNPYWTTKLVLENILEDLADHRWFQVFSLRYFNPIWAHTSGLIWENPNGIPNNLVPFIFKVVLWEQLFVKVFGNTYNTPDGTGVRDYIHVVDLAQAHLLAYQNIDKWNYRVCNIWTGKWTSVLEMLNIVSDVIGNNIPYQIMDKRPWDIATSLADTTKAKQILWWTAKKTIKEAIQDTWKFIKSVG